MRAKSTRRFLSLLLLLLCCFLEVVMSAETHPLTVEWYGQSCFLLTLQNGAKILLDPFDTTRIPYTLPHEAVDLIFSTHDHFDHNAVKAVPAKTILRATGAKPTFFGTLAGAKILPDSSTQVDLKGVPLICTTIPSFHDDRRGGMRGVNGIIRFTVENLTFVHLGDLGDSLSADQIARLKPVDVLMIPVGGYFTIDAEQAKKIVAALNPKIVLPMHYKTEVLGDGFPISGVEPFLEGYHYVRNAMSSTLILQAGNLPTATVVNVLKYHGQR